MLLLSSHTNLTQQLAFGWEEDVCFCLCCLIRSKCSAAVRACIRPCYRVAGHPCCLGLQSVFTLG